MDLGTVIGFVLAWGFVLASILMGGSLMMFVNYPSMMIVVGGTFAATMIAVPLNRLFGIAGVVMLAVFDRNSSIADTNAKLKEFAEKVRKEDLLSLENEELAAPFMGKAVRLAVDGVPVESIRQILNDEMSSMKTRHEDAQGVFEFAATIAPAMGMIGTLVGLVQMLQALDDPASIGPAMAVAMLTTLYGALIANLVCIPIGDKLKERTKVESRNMKLVIEGISSIVKGENSMITTEKLEAFLPPGLREGNDKEG